MFAIHSSSSSRELRFLEQNGDEFTVELVGQNLTASIRVSAFTDAKGLAEFFEELARQTMPWAGEESWHSLEGEFNISASCSVSGHVLFKVKLHALPGAAEEWQVSAGITSELGQLPKLASQATLFFRQARA